jgi:eukaryotic translation initiation factor 2C
VGTILAKWYESHDDSWPENIIYYRDGVSNDEYSRIQTSELDEIRKAISGSAQQGKKSLPDIKLTAIIVTKRHHTRFYPINDDDAMENGNCKPGTLVDSVVTKPYFVDFFLQSHHGIIGTARPARYDVIRNETGHSLEELQNLVSSPRYQCFCPH